MNPLVGYVIVYLLAGSFTPGGWRVSVIWILGTIAVSGTTGGPEMLFQFFFPMWILASVIEGIGKK